MTKIPPLWETLHSKVEIDRIETNAAWRDIFNLKVKNAFMKHLLEEMSAMWQFVSILSTNLFSMKAKEMKKRNTHTHTKKIKVVNAVGCVIPIPRV